MANKFRVSRAASRVEETSLELIRLAENYNSAYTDYVMRRQRRDLLEAARSYATAVRLIARVK